MRFASLGSGSEGNSLVVQVGVVEPLLLPLRLPLRFDGRGDIALDASTGRPRSRLFGCRGLCGRHDDRLEKRMAPRRAGEGPLFSG